jgi:DNA-binding Xre family transcriptional regulator
MKLSEAVATRVRALLAERKMTQGQLEKLSTIHRGTMNDLLQGVYKTVNLKTVHLIIRALGMKTGEFFNDPIFDRDDIEVD